MTTELEKQFFKTFGIKPIEYKSCDVGTFCPYPEKECGTDTCPFYKTYKVDYPAIGDRHYLELICILCKRDYELGCCWFAVSNNVEELKNYLLGDCIEYVNDIKHQVQELFKGE